MEMVERYLLDLPTTLRFLRGPLPRPFGVGRGGRAQARGTRP